MIRRFGLALTMLCTSAALAGAQQVAGRANGLAGSFGSFNFNSLGLNEGESLGSLSNNGISVSFQGAYYGRLPSIILYGPFGGSFGTSALYNYTFFQQASSTLQLDFTGATSAALFNYTTAVDPGKPSAPATFRAFKNGVQVGVFVNDFAPSTSQSRDLFWGFEFTNGTTFDRVTIEGNPAAFGIDNLQVSQLTTVPEPGTVGLLAFGLLGLGVAVRRRATRG